MMKLILSLTLIWTLSSTAEALQCWFGDDQSQHVLKMCAPAELCASTVTRVIKNGNVQTSTKKECVSPTMFRVGDHLLSHNIGFGATAEYVRVCNTDGCNSQASPQPGFPLRNNLQCFTCENPLSTECNKKVQCVGTEDRCLSMTVGDDSGKTVRAFGCASENVCKIIPHMEIFLKANFIHEPKCCGTHFCNHKFWAEAAPASDHAGAAPASDQAGAASASAWSVKLNVILLLFGLITLIVY